MSTEDLADAQPTIDTIGDLLNRISHAGYPTLHAALAGYVRERRGRLVARSSDATRVTSRPVDDLLALVPELQRLLDGLALVELATVERAIYMREGSEPVVEGEIIDAPPELNA